MLLATFVLSCGTQSGEEGASPGENLARWPVTPAPSPPVAPLIRADAGSATSVIQGGTATIAVDPAAGKGEFSFQRGDVKLEFGRGELPADFPADVPIPDGGSITSVLHGPGVPTQVLIRVAQRYESCRNAYGSALAANGWTVADERAVSKGEGSILTCRRGGRELQVTVKPSGDGSLVTLRLSGSSPSPDSGG